MPAKLERCVEVVIKQGHTKEEAYAICNASLKGHTNDSGIVTKDLFQMSSREKTPEGYLKVDAILARTGIQEYLLSELEAPEGATHDNGIVRVWRPADEVFNPESMASFAMRPITDDHPPEMLDSANTKRYQVGWTGQYIVADGNHMKGSLIITDKATIDKVDSGKVELSNGYYSDYIWSPGVTPDGEQYDAIQTNIRGNHVAIVAKGRCGGACRVLDCDKKTLTTDCPCKGGKAVDKIKLKVAGIDCEMEPVTAKLVQKQMDEDAEKAKTMQDRLDAMQKELDEMKAMMVKKEETAKANTDSLNAEITKAKAEIPTQQQIDKIVTDRMAFAARVKSIDAKYDITGKAPPQVCRDLVAAKYPAESFEGKSDDYMLARFEAIAVSNTDSMDAALADKAKGGQQVADSVKAREDFAARSREAYKNPNQPV